MDRIVARMTSALAVVAITATGACGPFDCSEPHESMPEPGVASQDPIQMLDEGLASGDRAVAEAAIQRLELVQSGEAVDSLGTVLERSDDVDLKLRSLEALWTFEGEGAARAAAVGLRDPDARVREAAVEALLVIAHPSAADSLWQAYSEEDDPRLQDLILDALESLGEDTERARGSE